MAILSGIVLPDGTRVIHQSAKNNSAIELAMAATISPRVDLFSYSDGTFAWGYGSNGSRQTALAILASASDDDFARRYAESFCRNIVVRWPGDLTRTGVHWSIDEEWVRSWAKTCSTPPLSFEHYAAAWARDREYGTDDTVGRLMRRLPFPDYGDHPPIPHPSREEIVSLQSEMLEWIIAENTCNTLLAEGLWPPKAHSMDEWEFLRARLNGPVFDD